MSAPPPPFNPDANASSSGNPKIDFSKVIKASYQQGYDEGFADGEKGMVRKGAQRTSTSPKYEYEGDMPKSSVYAPTGFKPIIGALRKKKKQSKKRAKVSKSKKRAKVSKSKKRKSKESKSKKRKSTKKTRRK